MPGARPSSKSSDKIRNGPAIAAAFTRAAASRSDPVNEGAGDAAGALEALDGGAGSALGRPQPHTLTSATEIGRTLRDRVTRMGTEPYPEASPDFRTKDGPEKP